MPPIGQEADLVVWNGKLKVGKIIAGGKDRTLGEFLLIYDGKDLSWWTGMVIVVRIPNGIEHRVQIFSFLLRD